MRRSRRARWACAQARGSTHSARLGHAHEGLNQNQPSVFDELIAPTFVIYDAPPGMQHGGEGFRQVVAMCPTAFPDLHVTFEEEFADGDVVIHRGYVTGTPPYSYSKVSSR
jgi:SnoaL-like polyketide cyclase